MTRRETVAWGVRLEGGRPDDFSGEGKKEERTRERERAAPLSLPFPPEPTPPSLSNTRQTTLGRVSYRSRPRSIQKESFRNHGRTFPSARFTLQPASARRPPGEATLVLTTLPPPFAPFE